MRVGHAAGGREHPHGDVVDDHDAPLALRRRLARLAEHVIHEPAARRRPEAVAVVRIRHRVRGRPFRRLRGPAPGPTGARTDLPMGARSLELDGTPPARAMRFRRARGVRERAPRVTPRADQHASLLPSIYSVSQTPRRCHGEFKVEGEGAARLIRRTRRERARPMADLIAVRDGGIRPLTVDALERWLRSDDVERDGAMSAQQWAQLWFVMETIALWEHDDAEDAEAKPTEEDARAASEGAAANANAAAAKLAHDAGGDDDDDDAEGTAKRPSPAERRMADEIRAILEAHAASTNGSDGDDLSRPDELAAPLVHFALARGAAGVISGAHVGASGAAAVDALEVAARKPRRWGAICGEHHVVHARHAGSWTASGTACDASAPRRGRRTTPSRAPAARCSGRSTSSNEPWLRSDAGRPLIGVFERAPTRCGWRRRATRRWRGATYSVL